MTDPARQQAYVRLWLYAVAFLIFCMVIVGGATRLTESGLSITEWQPLLGAIPPLSEAAWQQAFAKYKLIPQDSQLNSTMTLAEFKVIYWWEWSHRLLGRLIGLAFLLPFLAFAGWGWIGRRDWPRFIGLFILGGLQGALGWYMVASGLVDRVSVSQYRLSAHLTLATVIFAAMLWVAYGFGGERAGLGSGKARSALYLVLLVVLQVALGGLVAGLDAGMGYNTWPLMDGKLVPDGLLVMEPAWRNLFENAMTVQFDHRMLAYLIVALVAGHAYIAQSRAALLLFAAVLAQVALGIFTLLHQVPLGLALMHQGGALLVLAAALWNLHALIRKSPGPDRR
jgi:cytochrome c oxidase assembly protein subunit 15